MKPFMTHVHPLRFVALVLILMGIARSTAWADQRPNIVFVLFDDLGWGQPECYNRDSALRTPNLNRLAEQG